MAFDQFKLDEASVQTRGIFNLYVYRPQNGDTLDDIKTSGYFAASRFVGMDGWDGGIISCEGSDGTQILQIDSNGDAVPLAGSLTPEEMADALDIVLGNNSWRATRDQIYITSEQDMVDLGLLQEDTDEYPNGYYLIPANKALLIEGVVSHSLPIVANDASTIASGIIGTQAGVSTLNYNGGTGNGPVSQTDAGLAAIDAGFFVQGMIIQNLVSDVTAVVADGTGANPGIYNGVDNIFIAFKIFEFTAWANLSLSGQQFMFFQNTPSTFVNAIGEEANIDIANLETGNVGFGGLTGSGFDLTGCAGTLNLKADNTITEFTGANELFQVTDDDTIDSGLVTNCIEASQDIARFISGIDESSVNTTFSGNNFVNTSPGHTFGIGGNTAATLYPGDSTTWVTLAGTSVLRPDSVRWDSPVNWQTRYIGRTPAAFKISVDGLLRNDTGGTAEDYELGIFKNGSATPLFVVPISSQGSSNPRSGSNSISEPFDTNDYIEFKLRFLTGTVDAVVEGVTSLAWIGGN